MGIKYVLSFTFLSVLIASEAQKTIFCEKIEKVHWAYFWHRHTSCFINETTVIDSDDFGISSDANATGLYINENSKIMFLPIELNKIFPSLMVIDATSCSISKISYANFEGLTNLRRLWLRDNDIEEITSGTFKDLPSLIDVDLRKLN
jgi:Leucine rich repeat